MFPLELKTFMNILGMYVGVICNHKVNFAGPVTLLALQGHFMLMQ